VIRPARRGDLETLRTIEREAGQAFRALGMDAIADDEPPSIDALLAFTRAGRAWVAVDGQERPVAYVLAAVVDGNAHVEQVSVRPAWARRRLGAALIETVAGWGQRRGLAAVTLTTFAEVAWNRPYYERLGFTVVGEPELTGGLRRRRAPESELGLDRWPRVVMSRPLVECAP
jgi:GNAT superfamily N-acetyltransferase